jgi:hypothetical protein
MSNRSLARQLSRRSLYVDMYPIVHRRSLGELIDAFLCHFDPVADADFTPDGSFEFFEILEDPHCITCTYTRLPIKGASPTE